MGVTDCLLYDLVKQRIVNFKIKALLAPSEGSFSLFELHGFLSVLFDGCRVRVVAVFEQQTLFFPLFLFAADVVNVWKAGWEDVRLRKYLAFFDLTGREL